MEPDLLFMSGFQDLGELHIYANRFICLFFKVTIR